IWYFKGTPSRIGLLLDLSPRNLERILYFALYVVTSVDGEARQQTLEKLEESIQKQIQQLEDAAREDIQAAQGRRDALLATIERGVEEQREQSETERAEQLQQARAAEQSVRTLLRSNHGKVLAEDVLYEPTGERIAQRGAKADATHAEALDRIAQEHRDLIV